MDSFNLDMEIFNKATAAEIVDYIIETLKENQRVIREVRGKYIMRELHGDLTTRDLGNFYRAKAVISEIAYRFNRNPRFIRKAEYARKEYSRLEKLQ